MITLICIIWDVITHPCGKFNRGLITVPLKLGIDVYYIPPFYTDAIIYPCPILMPDIIFIYIYIYWMSFPNKHSSQIMVWQQMSENVLILHYLLSLSLTSVNFYVKELYVRVLPNKRNYLYCIHLCSMGLLSVYSFFSKYTRLVISISICAPTYIRLSTSFQSLKFHTIMPHQRPRLSRNW